VKVLSLWQPWASLIALGVKTIETRSWATKYRGPLGIHAAKHRWESYDTLIGDYQVIGLRNDHDALFGPDVDGKGRPRVDMPLGAIVATCELVDCLPVERARTLDEIYEEAAKRAPTDRHLGEPCAVVHIANDRKPHLQLRVGNAVLRHVSDASDQLPYGDFAPGRFAWLLADIKPLDPPVPATGHQGLWNWEAAA
jgi:hypothetical protein